MWCSCRWARRRHRSNPTTSRRRTGRPAATTPRRSARQRRSRRRSNRSNRSNRPSRRWSPRRSPSNRCRRWRRTMPQLHRRPNSSRRGTLLRCRATAPRSQGSFPKRPPPYRVPSGRAPPKRSRPWRTPPQRSPPRPTRASRLPPKRFSSQRSNRSHDPIGRRSRRGRCRPCEPAGVEKEPVEESPGDDGSAQASFPATNARRHADGARRRSRGAHEARARDGRPQGRDRTRSAGICRAAAAQVDLGQHPASTGSRPTWTRGGARSSGSAT